MICTALSCFWRHQHKVFKLVLQALQQSHDAWPHLVQQVVGEGFHKVLLARAATPTGSTRPAATAWSQTQHGSQQPLAVLHQVADLSIGVLTKGLGPAQARV